MAIAEARTLRSGFLDSVARLPNRPALQLGTEILTYAQLHDKAASFAVTLDHHAPASELPLTALLAHRSTVAYAAVLGALFRGHGYVPLNPGFPTDRTRGMLERSGCRSLIVDAAGKEQLDEVLAGLDRSLVVLLPECTDTSTLGLRWPKHTFIGRDLLKSSRSWSPRPVDPNGIGYLLFTSGSTGRPKGVMVAHRNVTHFVAAMVKRYAVTENDRFSQTFDLTFDLSAFDMFIAWEKGACLCAMMQSQKLLPAKYIAEAQLTIWFSVPSTAAMMDRLRMLKPGRYPNLRLSLFCGEALPADIMEKWAEAAPNSTLENLYGPTELTIACTLYQWKGAESSAQSEHGIVPIGYPYPGMEVLIADENLAPVPEGEVGELLMTGPQLSLGYYEDPERTKAAFVVPPGFDRVFYRTGDRVRRPVNGQPLIYLGRIDNQVKIQGYRVELGEIEALLRNETGADTAIAVAWPKNAASADGIVGFVAGSDLDIKNIKERVVAKLPSYMQPKNIYHLNDLPLNGSGKVDRNALQKLLDTQHGMVPL